MDKITLTLTTDTVQNIIYIIEEYIDDLYKERELYKGYTREKTLTKYIEECETYLNELKSSIPQEVKNE